MTASTRPDFRVRPLGTVTVVEPLTAEAGQWFAANVATEPWQWSGGQCAVEPRMATDLTAAILAAGFGVTTDPVPPQRRAGA